MEPRLSLPSGDRYLIVDFGEHLKIFRADEVHLDAYDSWMNSKGVRVLRVDGDKLAEIFSWVAEISFAENEARGTKIEQLREEIECCRDREIHSEQRYQVYENVLDLVEKFV